MKIEISNAEVIDKITILKIKIENIKDNDKLNNIKNEYNYLVKISNEIGISEEDDLYEKLYNINKKLWDIEDRIREKERDKEFDEDFIDLARKVYITNDERCRIKKQINLLTKSVFVEEKGYKEY